MSVIKSFTPPKLSATATKTAASTIQFAPLIQQNQNSQKNISPNVKSAAEILFAKFVQPQQNQPPQNLFKANSVTMGAPVPVGGTPKPVTFTPSTFKSAN